MKKLFLTTLCLAFFFSSTYTCQALNLSDSQSILEQGAGESGAGYNTEIDNPEIMIGMVINAFLSFLGVLFLILMIYGGFLWMTARGNESQVTKAKDLIIAAIIGLIIILLSYAISIFVVGSFSKEIYTG